MYFLDAVNQNPTDNSLDYIIDTFDLTFGCPAFGL